MIGAASEALVLKLRDVIVEKLRAKLGSQNFKKLKTWKIKTVLDEIGKVLDKEKANMPTDLKNNYEANWTPFTNQIRTARNEAGHPISIEPVTNEKAHASLLIFPEFAKLVDDIKVWISNQQ